LAWLRFEPRSLNDTPALYPLLHELILRKGLLSKLTPAAMRRRATNSFAKIMLTADKRQAKYAFIL
jgi:hypothetical protein